MSLKSVISKMPINVIRKTIISDSRVHVPGKIDRKELLRKFPVEINSTEALTNEKALYIASKEKEEKPKTVNDLMNFKLHE